MREKPQMGETSEATGNVEESRCFDDLLVFDWDDTLLPTSWLQRVHLSTASADGSFAGMAPDVLRQVARLSELCSQTLSVAASLGNVVFVTNSAPGWISESCEAFMPQLSQQIKHIPIFAKPLDAPLTFKIMTFQREWASKSGNLISVGDGNSERLATLSLRSGSPGVDSATAEKRRLKSVKLVELPSCQDLISQHELLQARLADIVAFHGNLDLKARFGVEPGGGGRGFCSFVHVPGRELGAPGQSFGGALPASPSAPVRGPSRTGRDRVQEPVPKVQEDSCQLPLLGSVRGRALTARRTRRAGSSDRGHGLAKQDLASVPAGGSPGAARLGTARTTCGTGGFVAVAGPVRRRPAYT